MQIALFGGNSSISKSLKTLLSEHNEVVTLGRSNSDIIIDINNIPNEFKLPYNLDTIVLTSADFGGNELDDYLNAINVNVIGVLKLFDLAINSNVKHFIFISSIYTHFEAKSPLSSIYSISKKFSEEVLLHYLKDKQIKLTIIRPTQIIGNFKSNRIRQPFFYSLIQQIKDSQNVKIFGKNDPKRNFIHIDDLSSILHKVILKKLEGVYDCAFPHNTSFLEITNFAKILYQSSSEISFDKTKPDIFDNVLNYNYDLYDLINQYPKITIFEAIKELDL